MYGKFGVVKTFCACVYERLFFHVLKIMRKSTSGRLLQNGRTECIQLTVFSNMAVTEKEFTYEKRTHKTKIAKHAGSPNLTKLVLTQSDPIDLIPLKV